MKNVSPSEITHAQAYRYKGIYLRRITHAQTQIYETFPKEILYTRVYLNMIVMFETQHSNDMVSGLYFTLDKHMKLSEGNHSQHSPLYVLMELTWN